MPEQSPRAAALVSLAGRLLYGPEWTSHLAADLRLNDRTVRRIKAADAAGDDYPVAPGVFADLRALLLDRATQLAQLADRL